MVAFDPPVVATAFAGRWSFVDCVTVDDPGKTDDTGELSYLKKNAVMSLVTDQLCVCCTYSRV